MTLVTWLFALLLGPQTTPATAPAPAPQYEELPVCAPPPKATVTVACDRGEGCEDKWIFVAPDLPTS
jgi:hypothetical protein